MCVPWASSSIGSGNIPQGSCVLQGKIAYDVGNYIVAVGWHCLLFIHYVYLHYASLYYVYLPTLMATDQAMPLHRNTNKKYLSVMYWVIAWQENVNFKRWVIGDVCSGFADDSWVLANQVHWSILRTETVENVFLSIKQGGSHRQLGPIRLWATQWPLSKMLEGFVLNTGCLFNMFECSLKFSWGQESYDRILSLWHPFSPLTCCIPLFPNV